MAAAGVIYITPEPSAFTVTYWLSKVISVRIKEDLLNELDRISKESNYSRNELINLILRYGIDNLEIIQ